MEEPTSVPVERTGPAPLLPIGLVGAAAAALIAVGILAAATSASPNGTLAAADATGNGSTSAALTNRGPGDLGGPGGRRGFGEVTISAISGSSISLKTADGWIRTITVDSGTTYQKSGATIGLTNIKVGDEIRFQETRETSGTFTIDSIAVVLPHTGGTVSAISGSTMTVTQPDGSSATINVGSSTTYDVAGNTSATLSDIKTGMVVMASGTRSADGSLTATTVRAFDPASMPAHGDRGFGHGMPGMDPDASLAPSATSSGSSG
jgi:hypothetical protein